MSKENKNEMRERSKESKVRNKRNTDGDGYSCDSTLRPRAYATRARAKREGQQAYDSKGRPRAKREGQQAYDSKGRPHAKREGQQAYDSKGRAHAKREAEVKSRLRRWLEKLEAEGIQDPVPVVVGHAVKVTHGTKDDRNKWMKIANRGINSFMGVLMEFEYDLEKPDMPRLRHLPSAFQARLNRVLPYTGRAGR